MATWLDTICQYIHPDNIQTKQNSIAKISIHNRKICCIYNKTLTATASKKESVLLIVILCLYIQNSWPRRLLPPIHFCSIQHPVQGSSSRTQDSVCLPRKLDRSLHFSLASRRMRIHLMKAQMVIPAIPILFASTLVRCGM